jgi:hypothetical protein
MKSESFFHCFPRDKTLRDLGSSLKILRSFLQFGILLVPEVVKYPAELRDKGDEKERIVNVQRRMSLTMLAADQLVEHCSYFGPLGIEYSSLAGRQLGAMPLIYLPQAAETGDRAALDQLGYFFIYRIAEILQMCDRLVQVRSAANRNPNARSFEIKSKSNPQKIEVDGRSLRELLDIITAGARVEDFSAALQAMSSLFYPTDEFRGSVEMVRSPLHYYRQREWRILSGVVVNGSRVDEPLTAKEAELVLSSNPNYFGEIIFLRHRQVRRVDACRLVRTVDGQPVRNLIRSVRVPLQWRQHVEDLLAEFSDTARIEVIGYDLHLPS